MDPQIDDLAAAEADTNRRLLHRIDECRELARRILPLLADLRDAIPIQFIADNEINDFNALIDYIETVESGWVFEEEP